MINVKNVFFVFKVDLMKDRLLFNYLQVRFLKFCIDMVVENFFGYIRVFEVQMVELGFYKLVMGFFKVFLGFYYNYIFVIFFVKFLIQLEMIEMGMEFIVWDIQEQYEWDQVYDLVVVSDVLYEQENVEKVVENFY